jgi:hypothetical protein
MSVNLQTHQSVASNSNEDDENNVNAPAATANQHSNENDQEPLHSPRVQVIAPPLTPAGSVKSARKVCHVKLCMSLLSFYLQRMSSDREIQKLSLDGPYWSADASRRSSVAEAARIILSEKVAPRQSAAEVQPLVELSIVGAQSALDDEMEEDADVYVVADQPVTAKRRGPLKHDSSLDGQYWSQVGSRRRSSSPTSTLARVEPTPTAVSRATPASRKRSSPSNVREQADTKHDAVADAAPVEVVQENAGAVDGDEDDLNADVSDDDANDDYDEHGRLRFLYSVGPRCACRAASHCARVCADSARGARRGRERWHGRPVR